MRIRQIMLFLCACLAGGAALSCTRRGPAADAAGDGSIVADDKTSGDSGASTQDGGHRDATVTARAVPLPAVVAVVAGGEDACALTPDGQVYCWGYAVGSPPVRVPTPALASRLGSVEPFCVEMAATKEWLCRRNGYWEGVWDHVIKDGRTIRSIWPARGGTILGMTTTNAVIGWSPPLESDEAYAKTPVSFRTFIAGPVSSVSRDGFCFVSAAGEVSCRCAWNYGTVVLSDRKLEQCRDGRDIVQIPELRGATVIVAAVGGDVCAELPTGGACFHDAPDGDRQPHLDIARLREVGPIREFANSQLDDDRRFNCALTSSGDVYCWGLNLGGVLGNVRPGTSTPVHVLMPRANAVTLGNEFGCALTEQREVYCWGSNREGQCGYGTRAPWIPALRATFADGGATAR